jgi:acyl dehydratase
MMTREEWNAATDRYILEENAKVGKPVKTGIDIPNSWPQAHSLITEEVIKDFAWNVGNPNPLYLDPAYAANTRWHGSIAPPGRFVHYIAETGSLARGNAVEGHNHLYGGTTYDCFDVIRAGDRYTIQDEYLGVEEKQLPQEKREKYRLLTMTAKRHYINQNGKIVVTATGHTIITCVYPGDVKKGEGNVVFGKVTKPYYTPEQLETIHQHYRDYFAGKLTRGSQIRYWEDVSEGEKITPLIKGPLDLIDMVGYLCAIGAQHGGAATKWNIMGYSLDVTPKDPETGEYMNRQNLHLSDKFAQIVGMPMALAYAALNETYVSEAVTNWMGDDGFVKKLVHQHRKACYHGDLVYIKGNVARKYIENNEHLVELSVWCENQKGEKVCPSSAIISLCSKDD